MDKLHDIFPINLRKINDLKYGPNPQQKAARYCEYKGYNSPLITINGTPGYTNILDALDCMSAALTVKNNTGKAASCVFKHDTPTGLAIYSQLNETLEQVFECQDEELSSLSIAFLRAWNTDPLSAFGGVVALSEPIDYPTAEQLKDIVIDAVVFPKGEYDKDALNIIKKKKNGNLAIFIYDQEKELPEYEIRSRFGEYLVYERNKFNVSPKTIEDILVNPDPEKNMCVPTKNKNISMQNEIDGLIAYTSAKFSQSNSVSMACDGQTTGVGGGGQSRVDVVEISGNKTNKFYLRQHPRVLDLDFKDGLKKQDRTITRIAYITGDIFDVQKNLLKNLNKVPEELTEEDKKDFLDATVGEVIIGSDAFFPFRDGIDKAKKYRVYGFLHTGISVRNDEVTAAADEHGMFEVRLGKEGRGFKH